MKSYNDTNALRERASALAFSADKYPSEKAGAVERLCSLCVHRKGTTPDCYHNLHPVTTRGEDCPYFKPVQSWQGVPRNEPTH